MEPADEMKFEVSTDVHGTADGPRLGRQRVINKVRSSPAVYLYDHLKHIFSPYTALFEELSLNIWIWINCWR